MDEIENLLQLGSQIVGRDLVIVQKAGEMQDFTAFGQEIATQRSGHA